MAHFQYPVYFSISGIALPLRASQPFGTHLKNGFANRCLLTTAPVIPQKNTGNLMAPGVSVFSRAAESTVVVVSVPCRSQIVLRSKSRRSCIRYLRWSALLDELV
jgi:hypothetical protein